MPQITDLKALSAALRHIRVGDIAREAAVLATVEIVLPISLHELFVTFTNMENKSLFHDVVRELNIGPAVPTVFLPGSEINDDYYRYVSDFIDDPQEKARSSKVNIMLFFETLYSVLRPSIHLADFKRLHASYEEAADWFAIDVISEFDVELRRCYPDPEADAAFDLARVFECDAKAAYDDLAVKMLAQILPPAVNASAQTSQSNPCQPLPKIPQDLMVINSYEV